MFRGSSKGHFVFAFEPTSESHAELQPRGRGHDFFCYSINQYVTTSILRNRSFRFLSDPIDVCEEGQKLRFPSLIQVKTRTPNGVVVVHRRLGRYPKRFPDVVKLESNEDSKARWGPDRFNRPNLVPPEIVIDRFDSLDFPPATGECLLQAWLDCVTADGKIHKRLQFQRTKFYPPNPPPPGVSMISTSPGSTSIANFPPRSVGSLFPALRSWFLPNWPGSPPVRPKGG
jgi:hypothetical protein